MNNKTILYISYDGMTDPLGQSQVLPYLNGLSRLGYKIHLLSFEKQELFEEKKTIIQKIVDQSGIPWFPKIYRKNPPIISTFLDIREMHKEANALHLKNDYAIVHCRSYISAIVGQKMQRKGVKFLFDIRGFWADERVDGKIWNLNNPIFKMIFAYFKKKEKHFFQSADGIVTLTNASKDWITEKYDFKGKITVIPCAADLELFCPQSNQVRNTYRSRLKLDEAFVLLYLGSVGTWYLLGEMFDFFKVLKKEKNNAKFLFVTGDQPTDILKVAKERGVLEQDIIVQKSARSEVPSWLSTADLSVFFIKNCFSKMASSPTKHGELLGVNVPVVCNRIGDLEEIVNFENSGIIVDGFDEKSYRKAVSQALLEDQNHNFERSSKTAFQFYSLKKGIDLYHAIYQSLI